MIDRGFRKPPIVLLCDHIIEIAGVKGIYEANLPNAGYNNII